ncbi:hypothetical protein NBRC110019_15700 [Neptunitalea chrysea]|uniref:Uncharacterized protein n=1 Tax=Neptunitalea chrysea TaxID=1647581 RepID=A0A9W6B6K7_9FLAO|nr:hypothetical protein [Neptunitalea chrysea]GLB52530.1 hypothetical protein NBRC110019_15700 [Neptunitalea chrysea]
MSKKIYYAVLVIYFALMVVNTVSLLFLDTLLLALINKFLLISLFFLIYVETYFIKSARAWVVSALGVAVFCVGVLFKITHWQFGFINSSILVLLSGLIILTNLILFAVRTKDKGLVNYFVLGYLGLVFFNLGVNIGTNIALLYLPLMLGIVVTGLVALKKEILLGNQD